ncbi:MAG: glycosyltransferase family 4 protein [Desulfomonile tiedjei]|nr:glycosyltransferase family 4 protein [Desulfomonile tiedjei]
MSRHLTLFFTRGVSLRTWSMMGSLEREVALYKRLLEHGYAVSFVTYGDASDLGYASTLGGIRVLCNERSLPLERYEAMLFSLHGRALAESDIIKTNQTYGAELALWASRLLGTRFVARCGYMWSLNAARERGEDSAAAMEARRVEAKAFRGADRVVVTAPAMRISVSERLPEVADRIRVIPNYVDTDTFRPLGPAADRPSLVFVGRIAPEKNLEALLQAVEPLGVALTLIGEGKLRPELHEKFAALDGQVTWEGNIPNRQLPEYLNRAGMFVLPSFYEGHPKALLEAMSCGIPVIAANSPGIREVVEHRRTGLLCGTDPLSIRSSIEELMANPDLRAELGRNARKYVLDHYSLDRILDLELAVLQDLAGK